VRATAVGDQSVLARIVRAVEAALSRRSDIERLVDAVARVFVPLVMLLAAAVAAVNILAGVDAGEALMRSITVLVIACPCALGVATPLAVATAIGAASRRGILISDPRSLERLSGIDTVLFDKTGTVTEGCFTLLEGDPAALRLVASLERYSEHPLGKVIVAEAGAVPLAEQVDLLKGRGLTGRVDGQPVFCGNRTLLSELGLNLPADMDASARAEEERGHTVVFHGSACQPDGFFVFGDRVRPDVRPVVEKLRSRGMEILIVSGDASRTVQAVGAETGADSVYAEVLPEGKRQLVARLQAQGRKVLMVGDGVNDGPALAQADLGIAMGTGTDLAMKASHMVLMSNRLERITDIFDLSRRTGRVIRQNLCWSFFYNILGITFAATGTLNPILGTGAMVVSSLLVAWNSSRLRRW